MSKICEQCRSYNQESKACSNYYANKSSANLPEKQNLCCYFEDKIFDYIEKDDKKINNGNSYYSYYCYSFNNNILKNII